jgi:undecaprenyldiphospho-muramoylpentapeptide beta-N-acetylglucosaminyltransferase
MRILIATGGTGGHLYPALALVSYIKTQETNCDFLFVGSKERLESQVVPKMGYDYIGMNIKGMSGSFFNKIKALNIFMLSLRKSKKIIKNFKPDIVIGFGGYVSSSIVLSASKLKIPTIIHEQNSIVGLANKVLIKHVDAIIACYDKAYKIFPKEKTYLLGNPRASEVLATKTIDIYSKYQLESSKKTVLIVMGSLGSASVNQVVIDSIPLFEQKNYQIIFVTGKNYYEDIIKQVKIKTNNIKIIPYVEDMPSMQHQVDLIISRAGASTIAEITSLGVASILIPSPYVASNHQEYNAKELVNKEAALMILERELTKKRLINDIDELINNPLQIKKLQQKAKELGTPNASKDIYHLILKTIGK